MSDTRAAGWATGRLFWKFLLACWATLLVTAAAVAIIVTLHERAVREQQGPLAEGPRASFAVETAAATLRHGGVAALKAFLAEAPAPHALPLVAVDADDRELTGRAVSAEAIAAARERASAAGDTAVARDVTAPDGSRWLLFVAAEGSAARAGRPRPPSPALPIVASVLAGLVLSALLAWYVTAPIGHLRTAFRAAAAGRLDTRVLPRMAERHDEIADLGRDFDQMVHQLSVLVGSQQRLLNDVSHELRSPLARLQAAIGLARQSPARMADMLDRIENEASRLDALVGEILALVRLEAGPDRRRIARIDLADLVAAIVDDARFEARGSGRDVRFASEADVTVDGDYESLHRAVENVVRNAVKYTAQGTPVEVELRAEPFREPGQVKAVLTVQDRGPGVAEDELGAIFEPFYRASNSNTRGGFGLGLAIACRAVKAHGGSISAQRRSGGGMRFTIELPAVGSGSPAQQSP